MKSLSILVVCTASCFLGCRSPEEVPLTAWPAPAGFSIQEDREDVWRSASHGSPLIWDDKYLYVRIACYPVDKKPGRFLAVLTFNLANGAPSVQLPARTIHVMLNGKCYDPGVYNAGLAELPPEEASCRVTMKGDLWIGVVRVSLSAIRAVGNPIVMNVVLHGVHDRRGPEYMRTDALKFAYPPREGGKLKFVPFSEVRGY